MEKITYEQVGETIYREVLANGLSVTLIPRAGLSKVFGFFLTDFGSEDLAFLPLGKEKKYIAPMGVAHFLEHKMFDKGDHDIFTEFSRLGSDANAFTNASETAYFFTATDQIRENVELLLDFVQEPFFSDATVEKEKGIITQEAQMYADQPDQRMFQGLLGALFHNHPIRNEVVGTIESINQITKEDLYTNYETFYHPSNMNLCIVGNFVPEEMIAVIKENQNKKHFPAVEPITRFFAEEPAGVATKERIIHMPVSFSRSIIGIKEYANPLPTEELQKRIFLTSMLLDYLFSKGGPFYKVLEDKKLIDSSFGYQRTCDKTYGFSLISSNTDQPEKFAETVKELLLSVKDLTIPVEKIERLKKRMIGSRLRRLDSIEIIGQEYPWYANRNLDYFNQSEYIKNITPADVQEFIENWISEEQIAVCSVQPESQAK